MLMKVNEHFRPFEILLFPEKLRNGLETGIFPYIMMIHLGFSLRRPKREKFFNNRMLTASYCKRERSPGAVICNIRANHSSTVV